MYIGNTPADKFQTLQKQSFTTSATDTYTLSFSVTNPQDLALFINNVRQNPNDAYTVSGTTLTLSSAITSSDTMYAVFLGRAVETVAPATGSVTGNMLSKPFIYDDASNGSVTGISVNNDFPTASTASSGTGSGIRFGVNDASFSSAFGDARGSEILSITQQSNGRSRDIVFKTDNAGSLGEVMRIAADGRNTIDSTNEKPFIIHHSDGSTVNMGFQNNAGNSSFIGFADSDFTIGPAGFIKTRIRSDGRITTFEQSTTNGALNLLGEAGSSNKAIVFAHVGNGSEVGSISTGSSSTAFNTSSDYRLKENVTYSFDATSRLKQLKPARFNFKTDADTTVDGFLAHEVSDIVPEAITGTKDEVDEEGNPVYQGIDQSKLVPLLVKTIQELEARITTLEGN